MAVLEATFIAIVMIIKVIEVTKITYIDQGADELYTLRFLLKLHSQLAMFHCYGEVAEEKA
jgi:hypothetical protein